MSTDSPLRQDARLFERIRDFFYREEVPYSLALVRIFMPLVLLYVMLPRWFHARELYSTDGAPCPLGLVYGIPNMLPMFSGEVIVVFHSVLILALIASSVGWCTRLSLAISTVLYIYLNLMDAVSTITKYSVIASHVMLILTLSQCGLVWSVDSWLARRRQPVDPETGEARPISSKAALWPQRLMQLMIGIVYFGAAITKMQTPEFFSGDQMTYWFLSNVNHANPVGELLSQFTILVILSSYIVIIWETLFLFLAWRGWGRRLMIPIGVTFHLATMFTLGLYVFPAVCCTIYFSFLREEDFRKLGARLAEWKSRWNLPAWNTTTAPAAGSVSGRSPYWSWATYGAALAVTALAGLGAEHLMDPYGIRRPEGRHTLKEISPEIAYQWLRTSEAIREEDKVFAFDLGTFMIGDSLANRRRVFEHGQYLVAQVNLNPPREDMYIECNLHDADGRILDRMGSVIPRERFRGHFTYELTPSYPPGEYQVILTSGGKELSRRTFRLIGSETGQDARTLSGN